MDFLSSSSVINSLSSLLEESRNASESTTEFVAPVALETTLIVQNNLKISKKNDKAIWTDDEIPSEDASVDLTDKRQCPNDISPASFDCTELVIKVHFPGTTMRELDLDVTKTRIRVESRSLRLFTYLPVSVKHEKGNAKFDPKKEVLTVVLPIDDGLGL
eukprot:gene1196-2324_t